MKISSRMKRVAFSGLCLVPWVMLFSTLSGIVAEWTPIQCIFLLGQILLPLLYLFPFCSLAFRFCKRLELNVFFALTLGLSGLAIFNYLTGRVFLLSSTVQWIAWVSCLIPEILAGFPFLKRCARPTKSFLLQQPSFNLSINHALTSMVAALFFLTWLLPPNFGAIYPPTAFDLSLLHLTLPRTYLYHEGIVNASWLRGTFVPQFAHILFTGGMAWTSALKIRVDLFPTFFSGTMYFFCLAGFLEFLKSRPRYAMLGFLIMMSFPILRWHLTTAYMEPTLMVCILATFISAATFLRTRKTEYFYLLAFFSAVSFCVKHFGALYALPIIIVTVLDVLKTDRKIPVKLFTKALLIAIGPILVFYHYNYILTGTPFFPFIFKPDNLLFWDIESVKKFSTAISSFDGGHALSDWLNLPWTISNSDKHSDTLQFPVGVLWLVLWSISNILFFARLFKKPAYDPVAVLFFLVVNLQTAIWYYASPVYRYLSSEMMLMAMYGVWMVAQLPSKVRVFLSLILFIYAYQNVGLIAEKAPSPPLSIRGVQSYWDARIPSYNALRQLQTKGLNPQNVVIYAIHDEGNWLYYPYPHLGDWFTVNNYWVLLNKAPEFLKHYFSSRKISHVLFNGYRAQLIADFPTVLGAYSACFKLIIEAQPNSKVKIYELDQDSPRCYDKMTPAHESVVILKQNFPYFVDYPFEKKSVQNAEK
jgi:hypothetical protein